MMKLLWACELAEQLQREKKITVRTVFAVVYSKSEVNWTPSPRCVHVILLKFPEVKLSFSLSQE